MPDEVQCAICRTLVERHCSYVCRIDLFADPTSEPIDTTGIQAVSAEDSLADVLTALEKMSADDVMDDVHRRFEFHLCRACQQKMLANPLGLPRSGTRTWDGSN